MRGGTWTTWISWWVEGVGIETASGFYARLSVSADRGWMLALLALSLPPNLQIDPHSLAPG